MEEDNSAGPGSDRLKFTPATDTHDVIDFSRFRKDKQDGGKPAAMNTKEGMIKVRGPSSGVPIPSVEGEPQERKILLSLTHGDIVVDGFLGLSQTFLAVGDAKGSIKFAAAPGMWLYARDITDDEEYIDEPVEPDVA